MYVCTRFEHKYINTIMKKILIHNNEVYVHILINHTSDRIIKSKFSEEFRDFFFLEVSISRKMYGWQLLYRTYF